MVITEHIQLQTQGETHIIDITEEVRQRVEQSEVSDGAVVLFNVGSTAGLTTVEFEPGLVEHDLEAAFERLAPRGATYQHELTWHDDNGHSHVRATMLGPSLAVPFVAGRLTLGTWQQIILIDFDTRPRQRTVICQIMGE